MGLISFAAMTTGAVASESVVEFDVNRLVAAEPFSSGSETADTRTASSVQAKWLDTKIVSIELNFSVFQQPQFAGLLDEVVFEIRSQRQTIQLADYFPKTSMASTTVGAIDVTEDEKTNRAAQINGHVAYPGIGGIDGNAAYDNHVSQMRVYQAKPNMELLSASGSLDRRTGAYFKLLRTNGRTLEGDHHVRLLFEVPSQWRGDSLLVTMRGFGRTASKGSSLVQLGQSQYTVALFLAADEVASRVALGLLQYEQRLLQITQQNQEEIQRRTYPTPWHRMGASLSMVEPEIPRNWLSKILFSTNTSYPSGEYARLPVDVRAAILDYLDQRAAVDLLAGNRVPKNTTGAFHANTRSPVRESLVSQ
jgi:hypothetical protein